MTGVLARLLDRALGGDAAARSIAGDLAEEYAARARVDPATPGVGTAGKRSPCSSARARSDGRAIRDTSRSRPPPHERTVSP